LSTTSEIDIRVERGMAVMRFSRPRVRNAISLAMWEATATFFERFSSDESVRAVVLTGESPDFSVGADISEFASLRATVEQASAYEDAVDAATEAIARCPKPVIAAISGYCLGGACHLSMACDFRLAHTSAKFGIPAARLSIVYGVSSTDRLRNLVGLSHAKRILFGAEQFDAQAALRIGFVDGVFDDPIAEAREMAGNFARNAPLSISGAKLILNGLARGNAGIERTARLAIDGAARSDDFREGTLAFAEKRAPRFLGR
jgi:enoyl-CoA hydratase/carnithine racemase